MLSLKFPSAFPVREEIVTFVLNYYWPKQKFNLWSVEVDTPTKFLRHFREAESGADHLESILKAFRNQSRREASLIDHVVFAVVFQAFDRPTMQTRDHFYLFSLRISKDMIGPVLEMGEMEKLIALQWVKHNAGFTRPS